MNSYRKTNTNYTKMRLNEPTKFLYKLTHMQIRLSSTSCKKSHFISSRNDLKIERILIWEESELWERSELREKWVSERRVTEQGVSESEQGTGTRGRRMFRPAHARLSRPPDATPPFARLEAVSACREGWRRIRRIRLPPNRIRWLQLALIGSAG
jgi:hypothetical protein